MDKLPKHLNIAQNSYVPYRMKRDGKSEGSRCVNGECFTIDDAGAGGGGGSYGVGGDVGGKSWAYGPDWGTDIGVYTDHQDPQDCCGDTNTNCKDKHGPGDDHHK